MDLDTLSEFDIFSEYSPISDEELEVFTHFMETLYLKIHDDQIHQSNREIYKNLADSAERN